MTKRSAMGYRIPQFSHPVKCKSCQKNFSDVNGKSTTCQPCKKSDRKRKGK